MSHYTAVFAEALTLNLGCVLLLFCFLNFTFSSFRTLTSINFQLQEHEVVIREELADLRSIVWGCVLRNTFNCLISKTVRERAARGRVGSLCWGTKVWSQAAAGLSMARANPGQCLIVWFFSELLWGASRCS